MDVSLASIDQSIDQGYLLHNQRRGWGDGCGGLGVRIELTPVTHITSNACWEYHLTHIFYVPLCPPILKTNQQGPVMPTKGKAPMEPDAGSAGGGEAAGGRVRRSARVGGKGRVSYREVGLG